MCIFSTRTSVCLLLAWPLSALATDSPNLGEPVSEADIAAWDIGIGPDGRGLPPGRGSAIEGERIYEQHCLTCHGVRGAGQPHDRLVGGRDSLASTQPVQTVGSYWPYATTLFDYVRRAMPWTAPKSLTNDEVYAVSAYLLYLNGVIPQKLYLDARTLPRVKMPNRNGFVPANSPAQPSQ